MADTPKWLESLLNLSPEKALKRMKGWKPRTLERRAEKVGLKPFAESTIKRMKKGTFTPAEATVERIAKRIVKAAKEVAAHPAAHALTPLPVSMGGKWTSLPEWLEQMRHRNAGLNAEFSEVRLGAHGFAWVYEEGRKRIFTNKKTDGAPAGKPAVPMYAIYTVTVDTADDTETWVQASESSPQLDTQEARTLVKEFQENNEQARDYVSPIEGHYTWWARYAATESDYKFIGVGVVV